MNRPDTTLATATDAAARAGLEAASAPPREIAGSPVIDVRPFGRSRAGTVSWLAQWRSRPVRLLRCPSAAQAGLIAWVSRQASIGRHFPPCLEAAGNTLVVEWIEGESLGKRELRDRADLVEALGDLLARIHAIEVPEEHRTGEIYLEYLWARWERVEGPRLLPELDERLRGAIEAGSRAAASLSHPDLAPQNLILDSQGAPVSIDNELLASSSIVAIDLFNPRRYFGRGLRARRNTERFLRAYSAAGGVLERLVEGAPRLEAAWRLRRVGSLLEDGRAREARADSRRFLLGGPLTGGPRPHSLVGAARRLLGR